jgi:hypothetical protein
VKTVGGFTLRGINQARHEQPLIGN